MNRSKEPTFSLCERSTVLRAIRERRRIDGRGVYDYRDIVVHVTKTPGNITVTLGDTRVHANVSCEVVSPRQHRPTDGHLYFNVELSPMASCGFEIGSSSRSSVAIETTRMLERIFKESRAIDTESLCIIAGSKVWSIRVDLQVLDHCGNILDCAVIATITALKHFRRPDVKVIGEEATIYTTSEREPVPLTIHHMPICVSFAFFHDGQYLVVDQGYDEERVMETKVTIAMNIHKEICALQYTGGVALLPEQILRCVDIATVKVNEINGLIQRSLKTPPSVNERHILRTSRNKEYYDFDHIRNLDTGDVTMTAGDVSMTAGDPVLLDDSTREIESGVEDIEEGVATSDSGLHEEDVVVIKGVANKEDVTIEDKMTAELLDSEEDVTMVMTGEELGFRATDRPRAGENVKKKGKRKKGTRNQKQLN